jgi:hypothetical protein
MSFARLPHVLLVAVLLIAGGGCCGVRLHEQDGCSNGCCQGASGFHHPWIGHPQRIAEPAPIPPPHPKFHPVPTRPVFAPRPY